MFDLPEKGLIFVGGEVQDSQMSSSNGAGKSALFEALCYGLFGKTLRGSSANEVINWQEGKNCLVEVTFVDDRGVIFSVQRWRNDKEHHNDLFLFRELDGDITGKDSRATQEMIEAALGMTWQVFSTAVVFGEKAQRFTEAKDSEKKEIFDEILMMGRYQEAQKIVREDWRQLRTNRTTIQGELTVAESGMASALREEEETEVSITQLEKEKADSQHTIEEIEIELAKLEPDLADHARMLKAAADEKESLEATNKELMDTLLQSEKNKSAYALEAGKPIISKRIELNGVSGEIDKLNNKSKSLLTLRGQEKCPTCGQPLSAHTVEGVAKEYKAQVVELNKKKAEIEADIIRLSKIEAANRAKLDKDMQEITSLKADLDKQAREQKTIIITETATVSRLTEQREMLNVQKVGHESRFAEREKFLQDQLNRIAKRLESYEALMGEKKEALAKLDDEEKYIEFWEEGFGNQGIKSFLLDEILPSLNERANFYASALMGEDIRIEFDTQSELKSGLTRDKFDVKIYRGESKVDYAACSNGEKRRIDVAILLALQSLVFERNASSCNLVVLDEVFDSLDRTGVERVVNLLAEEAKEKAIFVISHLSEFRDYFEKEITVRKRGGVSELLEKGE